MSTTKNLHEIFLECKACTQALGWLLDEDSRLIEEINKLREQRESIKSQIPKKAEQLTDWKLWFRISAKEQGIDITHFINFLEFKGDHEETENGLLIKEDL